MSRPKVVIVGAGLGGCVLAYALLESYDVTIVERGAQTIDPRFPLIDVGLPARTEPHFGAGLGGSTQLWHNGLIEIDESIFDADWPIKKSELASFYSQAFLLLSGIPQSTITEAIDILRKKYKALGLPGENLPGLFYPRWPINVWETLKLEGRVDLISGDVVGFEVVEGNSIGALTIRSDHVSRSVEGDVFVFAAGGLGTPVLLQKLAQRLPLHSFSHAGYHYEDHPMGFVGEVELTVPLYQLWNYHVRGTGGNLRLPLVVETNGTHFSFQLRPAAAFYRDGRRQRVDSVLHNLRRSPWNPLNYVRLLSHWDDVLDILSFKLGIRLPTKHYTLLMMAAMPPAQTLSIWSETDPVTGQERRVRDWQFTDQYKADLDASVRSILAELKPLIKRSRIFDNWSAGLATGAHHSGTARMARSEQDGVCDKNGQVFGMNNLFVCDGSVIPASGIANTGLTISALALRLGDFLRNRSAKPA